MKIGGNLARNIDFEAAEFRVRYENSWENIDFELQSMKNPEVLHEMLVLKLQPTFKVGFLIYFRFVQRVSTNG